MFVGGKILSRTLRRSIYKPKQGIVLRPGSPENRPGPSPVQKNHPPSQTRIQLVALLAESR